MGGMELGNEAVNDQSPDWTKVAISTGFGMVFNKPTRIGEAITNTAGRPVRALLGKPEPAVAEGAPAAATTNIETPAIAPQEATPEIARPTTAREWNETILGQRAPTIAEAGDLGVAGPGMTEATFQGSEEANPQAAMTAQQNARTEQSVIGEPTQPDVNTIARRMEPETFQQYDDLVARQNEFRRWISDYNEPPPAALNAFETQRADLQKQLDDHIASQNGYTGGKQARQLRAQLRDVENQRQELADRGMNFLAGKAEETADLAQARKHLMATEFELRDLQPKVRAAYRRAAEATGAETVEPIAAPIQEPLSVAGTPEERIATEPERIGAESPVARQEQPPTAEVTAATEPPKPLPPQTQAEPVPVAGRTIEQQRDFIRQDVARQLINAGRPKEEAELSGALAAAYYETRAARLAANLKRRRNYTPRRRGDFRPRPEIGATNCPSAA